MRKFGTVDRRPGSGGRHSTHWWKRRHSWVAGDESGRQTSGPSNSHRNFTWGGDPSVVSFADYSQRPVSQVLGKKARSLTISRRNMQALFSVYSLRDDNVITSKSTWKLKHAHSIPKNFEYFCQFLSESIIIIFSYTVSKYRCVF